MFKQEFPGSLDNFLYYVERIVGIITNLFSMLFGGSSSDETTEATTAETTTATIVE